MISPSSDARHRSRAIASISIIEVVGFPQDKRYKNIYLFILCMYIYLLYLSSLLLQSCLSLAHTFVLKKKKKRMKEHSHPSLCIHAFASLHAARKNASPTTSSRSPFSLSFSLHSPSPMVLGVLTKKRAARERVPKHLTSNNEKQE